MTLDLRCYLVTSGIDRHTIETAAAAAGAGAGMVQVRAKELSTRDLLSLVLQVGEAVRRANPATRVVVDDRADVAWAAIRAATGVAGVAMVRAIMASDDPAAVVRQVVQSFDEVRVS